MGRRGNKGSEGNASNPIVETLDVSLGGRRVAGKDVEDVMKLNASAARGCPDSGGLVALSLTIGLSSVDRGGWFTNYLSIYNYLKENQSKRRN